MTMAMQLLEKALIFSSSDELYWINLSCKMAAANAASG